MSCMDSRSPPTVVGLRLVPYRLGGSRFRIVAVPSTTTKIYRKRICGHFPSTIQGLLDHPQSRAPSRLEIGGSKKKFSGLKHTQFFGPPRGAGAGGVGVRDIFLYAPLCAPFIYCLTLLGLEHTTDIC